MIWFDNHRRSFTSVFSVSHVGRLVLCLSTSEDSGFWSSDDGICQVFLLREVTVFPL